MHPKLATPIQYRWFHFEGLSVKGYWDVIHQQWIEVERLCYIDMEYTIGERKQLNA